MKQNLFFLLLLNSFLIAFSQSTDSSQNITNFSGFVGITTNGFSIIPSFSLNSPAFISQISWRKKRFSFDPDIRLVPNGSRGGALFWLRYRPIENKKFILRLGVHPAINLNTKTVIDNGESREITEMLRFLAFEIVPIYQVSKNFGVSALYLQGHGVQDFGPQLTKVLFLNSSIKNIGLSENVKFHLFPSLFFLDTDGYRGDYFTVKGELVHLKFPIGLQATINQTIQSNVPGNSDFLWNVAATYNFNKNLKKVQ